MQLVSLEIVRACVSSRTVGGSAALCRAAVGAGRPGGPVVGPRGRWSALAVVPQRSRAVGGVRLVLRWRSGERRRLDLQDVALAGVSAFFATNC